MDETRERCGVSSKNKYFFTADSTGGHMNTWLVLHNHAAAAGVDNPRLISSTRLRKYVATLAQVWKFAMYAGTFVFQTVYVL